MEVKSMMDWISRSFKLKIWIRCREKLTLLGQEFFLRRISLHRLFIGLPIPWPWWKINSKPTLESLVREKRCKKSWIRGSRTKALPCTRIHPGLRTTHLSAYPKTPRALTGWTILSLYLRRIVKLWLLEPSILSFRKTRKSKAKVRQLF